MVDFGSLWKTTIDNQVMDHGMLEIVSHMSPIRCLL